MKNNNKLTWHTIIIISISLVLLGCTQNSRRVGDRPAQDYQVSSLVKTDLGEVIEVHVEESRNHLKELMIKLYKRNPRELNRSQYASTIEENVVRLFDLKHNWHFREFPGKYGSDVILLSFDPDYQGDRVFTLIAGLMYMVMEAYNNKRTFYLFQSPDPQNLYNLARNIEITIWKLGNSHDGHGELYLYSNSLANEEVNLSYERLFGKLIGLQDTMAIITSARTNLAITKIIQQMASAVFLPIL